MTALALLTALPLIIAIGMVSCIAGRLALVRLANGRYRGSFAAWLGFLGGALLAFGGAGGMVAIGIWGIVR